jgi:acyl-CoA synthetase (AMP-forming)/AMP-acid ligase II
LEEDRLAMSETIPQLSREAAARFGDRPALIAPDGASLSFRGLDALADRVSAALLADGMAAGERVAIWAPNCFEWIAAAIGIQRVGGVMIPLYFRFHAAEVAGILARAKASYLVCSSDLARQLRASDTAAIRRIVVVEERPGETEGREIGWSAFLKAGDRVGEDALRAREAGVGGETVSDIMFTSGTTGQPKGAVFTHRSSVAAARIMQDYNGAGEADCFCPMGSFAHVGGYKQGWVTGLASGASVAWGDAFDPGAVLDLIARLGITIMPAAPITWQGVLDYPRRGDFDIAHFRFAATGGTMIPPELVRRLNAELDVTQVGTGYGMTETCGMNAYTRRGDPPDKVARTAGMAAPDTEIRIVGADGRDLAAGENGEILIRNPRQLIAYLDDPEATRAAVDEDGWFHSGDVGNVDAEGYLAITDRLKDMYIINGLNVYPAEIERTLELLGGVQQCAVIGVSEPVKGEVGAAFVVRAPGSSLSEGAVVDWCRQRLASFKVPKSVVFVDDLPRNLMGKVLKNELRTAIRENHPQEKGLP